MLRIQSSQGDLMYIDLCQLSMYIDLCQLSMYIDLCQFKLNQANHSELQIGAMSLHLMVHLWNQSSLPSSLQM